MTMQVAKAVNGGKPPTGEEVIRVAIVDDHPIMRDGLVHTFRREIGFEVVGQGGTGAEAIEIAETLLPDIIFLDINMPGDGVRAARSISSSCPAVRTRARRASVERGRQPFEACAWRRC